MNTQFLTMSSKKVIHQIPFSEIVHVQSRGMSVIAHTSSGEKHTCCKNIGEILKVLNKSSVFFRVHTSHVVNLTKIKMYKKDKGGIVVMENESEIPISKRRRPGFLKKYMS